MKATQKIVQRKTTHNTLGLTMEQTWTLDFSNCSDDDIINLAVRSVVIDIQRMIRATGSKEGMAAFDGKTYDIKDLISNRRTGKTPTEKAELAMAKLTPEQVAEIVAKYQKAKK